MQSRMPLIIAAVVLLLGLGVGLFLVLRPEGLPFGSQAGIEPTPLPTLAAAPTEAVPAGSADLNQDGEVDNADATLWQQYLKQNDLRGDLDGDSKVSSTDFQALREQASSP